MTVSEFGGPEVLKPQDLPAPTPGEHDLLIEVHACGLNPIDFKVRRGALTNPLPGQTVELIGGGAPKTSQTDAAGRATFSGLAPGTRVKAVVVVGGERVETQEFAVPATGGTRVILVTTDPAIEKKAAEDRQLAAAPAVEGSVVFGYQSRFVIEVGDDALNVFNILQIVNA